MRLFRVFSGAVTLLLIAIGATSAAAIPDAHVLPGEAYPVVGEQLLNGTAAIELSTALSSPIIATDIHQKLTLEELSNVFKSEWELLNSTFEGEECNTIGDESGVISGTGTASLVYLSLSPLTIGLLYLLEPRAIECGPSGEPKIKIRVEGSVLAELPELAEAPDTTLINVNLKCTKPNNGKQEWKEYYNEEEKLVKAILKANLGLGSESACEEVKAIDMVNLSKMIGFLNL